MAREDETEVLVVGAGPVGMLTALLLAEKGVPVRIIDKEQRTATRSYACVLHPGTLRLLDRLGLAHEALGQGRRIETIAFYEGESRRAEAKLSALSGEFPCAVVLPQSAVESLLEQRLHQQPRIQLLWNHRLSDMQFERDAVVARIDKLVQSAKGYIIREWDWSVQKTLQSRANFVVGADGHGSMVRSRLGIELEAMADPELFAVFEFETDRDPGNEVRIVIAEGTTNVLWPLPGNRCRWSFQLVKTKEFGQFPDKEREAMWSMQTAVDENTRDRVEKLARMRAPWFQGNIRGFYWWAHIRLQHLLVKHFGKGRAWLAGDAAHQTGPVGAQSMNAGMAEAEALAGTLAQVLRGGGSLELLEKYSRAQRDNWEGLLGRKGGLNARPEANTWVQDHGARILPCIPALGDDLKHLLGQLGFDVTFT
jgi:2-polyprenyl-6-methoxyphenol hydroxylase-like FAD-dependent oxidoreductase